MDFWRKNLLGIVVCMVIAAGATLLAGIRTETVSMEVVGAPVFGILIGMVITALFPKFACGERYQAGIKFTSKKILQYAVVILGFSLNMNMIVSVGASSLPVICSTIAASLIVAFLMMKLLKMDGKTSCLIGVGSSICGGSAIAATAMVIDADDQEVAQAISVIFLFNVLAALVFPTFGYGIGFGSEGFAIFAGTAVNDTSSVTACASTAEGIYGVEGILSTAVTVKLTRTLAIIPITFAIALYRARKGKIDGKAVGSYSFQKVFPKFILFFLAAAIVTTVIGKMPTSTLTNFYMNDFIDTMKWLAKFFIAMAMAAVGLNTNIVELIKKGGKPVLMGFCCWVAITAVSIYIQLAIGSFYADVN